MTCRLEWDPLAGPICTAIHTPVFDIPLGVGGMAGEAGDVEEVVD